MARIRLGDFGNAVAPLAPRARVPAEAFVQDDGGMIEGARKATVTAMVNQRQAEDQDIKEQRAHELQVDIGKQRERFHVEQQRARELEAAARLSAHAGYQADVDDLTHSLTTQLQEGKIKREQYPELLNKGLEDAKKKRLEGLDAESQATVTAHMVTAERRAQSISTRALDLHSKQERIAKVNDAMEQYQRLGVRDPARAVADVNAFLDREGPGLFGADKVAGQKQAFAERVYATHFMERLTGARNNYGALTALEKDIAGNAALDPDKKNILVGRIASMKEHLAAAGERAERSRLANVQHQIAAMDSLILKGFEPNAQQFMAVQQAAKGTPYEAVVSAQVQFANQSAQFRAMPPRAQEAFINQFEAQIRANPSPDGVKTLESFRTINRNQIEMIKEDPISFAAQKRLAEVQPLDFSKPDALGEQLKARATVARGMAAQYGAPLKVLTTQESQMLADVLKKGPVEQKRSLLGALYTGIGDINAYRATMSQLAKDDPVLASAGIAEGRRLSTDQGGRLADLMLRGQQILRPDTKSDGQPVGGKLLTMPKDEDLRRSFNSFEKDVFAGREQTRNVYFQSARSIYAALSVESGDYSGDMNSRRWEAAMKLATGGIEKHNGRAIVMPYGWNRSEFRDALKSKATSLAASGRLEKEFTAGELLNLPMENAADGMYVFRVGNGVLVDKTGKPVTVQFTP